MTITEEIKTKLEIVEKTQDTVNWTIAVVRFTNDLGDNQLFVFNTDNDAIQNFSVKFLINNDTLAIKLNYDDEYENLISKEKFGDIYQQCWDLYHKCCKLYNKNEQQMLERNILKNINGYFNMSKISLEDISLSFWIKIFSNLSFSENELEYIFKHIYNFSEVKKIYISSKD